jgi:hypothetical protein
VTTHSADLLDQLDPGSERLLVVQARNGVTEIGQNESTSQVARP